MSLITKKSPEKQWLSPFIVAELAIECVAICRHFKIPQGREKLFQVATWRTVRENRNSVRTIIGLAKLPIFTSWLPRKLTSKSVFNYTLMPTLKLHINTRVVSLSKLNCECLVDSS